MDKKEYSNIKKYIRSLCIDSVRELGTNVGLTDYEIKLLEHINRNDTRVYISLSLGVCETKVSRDTKKTFVKVLDYLKKNNLFI